MARVLVLDVVRDEVREANCHNLSDFYRELNADTLDIARRGIGGWMFDIFVDDEGLLKADPIVSAVDGNLNPMLVGNLVFANHDGHGNTVDLTDEDIEHIKSYIYIACTEAKPDGYKIVTNCEYF